MIDGEEAEEAEEEKEGGREKVSQAQPALDAAALRAMDKFSTRWIECWGGSRVYAVHVYDRGWRRVSRTFKSSEASDKLRDRMNADWRRYQAAMWDKPRRAAG